MSEATVEERRQVDPDIVVQVLEERYHIVEFAVEYVEVITFEAQYGGVLDPLGQLITWLWDQISGAIDILRRGLEGFITTVRDYIISAIETAISATQSAIEGVVAGVRTVVDAISAGLASLSSFVESFAATISAAIAGLGSTLAGAVLVIEEIWKAIQGFVAAVVEGISAFIKGVADTILGAIKGVADIAGKIWTFIQGIAATIVDTLSKALKTAYDGIIGAIGSVADGVGRIWAVVEGIGAIIVDSVAKGFEAIWISIAAVAAQILEGIRTLGTTFQLALTDLGAYLAGSWEAFLRGFADTWAKVQEFFKDAYNSVVKGLTDVAFTLQGFATSLAQIVAPITGLVEQVTKFLTGVPEAIGAMLAGAWKWISETLVPMLVEGVKALWSGLVAFGQWVWTGVVEFGKIIMGLIRAVIEAIIGAATGVAGALKDLFVGLYTKLFAEPIGALKGTLMKFVDERWKEGRTGEYEFLFWLTPALVGAMVIPRIIGGLIGGVARTLRDVHWRIGIPGTNIQFRFMPGAMLWQIGECFWDMYKQIWIGMMIGANIWIWRPIAFGINAVMRNLLPVRLPEERWIVDVTRRVMPRREFAEFLDGLYRWFALYGYSDTVVAWYTRRAREWYVQVIDRFGRRRRLPVSLLYELPTASDYCRMMVRDVFGPPEEPYPSFRKAILMRGMVPDVALMYYMLHFRYPPLERLFEFICRASAGYTWVDVRPIIEAGLGFPGMSPKQLGDRYKGRPIESVRQLIKKLVPYSKWWDYAPFPWIPDFTADRLIMLDLMADIPTRIDARWMYKWMVIEDEDLMRITVARGMHPDWVLPVATAEAMNALAEERTYARTGPIMTYRDGFMTLRNLEGLFKKLTTVRILGTDVPVRFLPGEVALLSLRAKYDRSRDILRDYSRDLVRMAGDHLIAYDAVVSNLNTLTGDIARKLNIKLSLDREYWELYKPVVKTLLTIYTFRRVRIWIRYGMWRLLARISSGFVARKDVEGIVDDCVRMGRLTPQEREILMEFAMFMYDFVLKSTQARGILRKLARGAISEADARRQLEALGLDREVIDGLVEQHAKIHVISPDKFVSMMEHIPVPSELFVRKLDMVGVPEDERRLYVPYATARMLASEMRAVATEIGLAFVDGVFTEQQFRRELDDLATLWGTVPRQLGVEWIVLSPEERDMIVRKYKLRRLRKEVKAS